MFAVGRLVLLVLQFPDSEQDVLVGISDNLQRRFLLKMWPLPGTEMTWPPPLGVDDEGLTKLTEAMENGLIQIFT